jgi:hypothetical protein
VKYHDGISTAYRYIDELLLVTKGEVSHDFDQVRTARPPSMIS